MRDYNQKETTRVYDLMQEIQGKVSKEVDLSPNLDEENETFELFEETLWELFEIIVSHPQRR